MTNEDLEKYLLGLGWRVENIIGSDGQQYIVIRGYVIPAGELKGHTCDIALLRSPSVPYVPQSAIHTRPALVPMDMNKYRTQQSGVGAEWQYWSRVVRGTPTPQSIVAHIATIFSEVRL